MIDCREFERALRAPELTGPTGEMRAHASTCRDCAAALRGALLLRLGSERPGDAVTRPGFEARLRARLAAARAVAPEPDWNAAVGALRLPAFGAALVLVLCSAGFYLGAASTPAVDSGLASLIESDPAWSAVLSDGAGALLPTGAEDSLPQEVTR
ncbi:MAG TPA: hypothetical protein VFT43_02360 [Candidatus Polarisedimenticolia bacterium]|nr:hypothetical protein [Candidatus Polarisedimenticolia bacterium]